jgi:mono/diheme cytochrome c family protein
VFRHRHVLVLVTFAIIAAGCEGARNNSSWSTASEGDPIVPLLAKATPKEGALAPATGATTPAPATTTSAAGNSGRGVGPVDKVDIASLTGAHALKGAELFKLKCSACHKLDERYIGPALAGVTKRRQPEWILNMILNPENMIQQDPTAKALLAEFLAPMANQHLTREEAESILAYFLEHDGALPSANSQQQASVNNTEVQAAQQ